MIAGCGVDIPSHFYSWSWSLNPNWTHQYVGQQEILECTIPRHPVLLLTTKCLCVMFEYGVLMIDMEDEARRWGIDERIRFNVECVGAEWSDLTSLWTVKFLNLVTGEEFSRRCRVLISCIGIFREGNPLNVPGTFPCPLPQRSCSFEFQTYSSRFDSDYRRRVV